MDSKDLLSGTRAEFMRAFALAIQKTMPIAKEQLFQAANASFSSSEQTRLLQGRIFLVEKDQLVSGLLAVSMERMLNRSFQTTYNSFRPASALDASADNLSLIDSSAFEDELRINDITNRFRTEAEEPLRDLNIRIALIFGQDVIKERENPFRPYMFSRAIANAFDNVGLSNDLVAVLIEQFADSFAGAVAGIYAAVNSHLAENGVAAQLQLKIQKSASSNYADQTVPQVDPYLEQALAGIPLAAMAQLAARAAQQSGHFLPMAASAPASPPASPAQQSRKRVEKLFASVRGIAAGVGPAANDGLDGGIQPAAAEPAQAGDSRGAAATVAASAGFTLVPAAPGHFPALAPEFDGAAPANDSPVGLAPGEPAHPGLAAASAVQADEADAAPSGGAFAWLPGNQAVGSVLRKFFSSKSAMAVQADSWTEAGTPQWHPGQTDGPVSEAASYGSVSGGTRQGGPRQGGPRSAPLGDIHSAGLAGNDTGAARPQGARRGSTSADRSSPAAAAGLASPEGSERGVLPGQGAGRRLVDAVQQLQNSHTPATGQMLTAQGEVRNLILEQRSALADLSDDVDEQMTIDVVAMLFEFILRDPQVPAEVRAQLGRLQFIVLKVALRDTSLLTQPGHPARMLVNRIGSISVGLKQLDPTGVHITAEICRIVDTLLRDEQEDAPLFSRMLDEFDAFIALELRGGNQRIARTVDAVEQVQNRTLRFAHTAAQLSEALHGLTIDPYLTDFLNNRWVAAIEMAERTYLAKARRYRLLVSDVLWSIVPKATEHDRSQLSALLPIMLNTLREGLTLIGTPQAEQQQLMNWLVAAHTGAMRGAEPGTHVVSLASIHEHFDNFASNADAVVKPGPDYDAVAQNRRLMDQAIKELDLQVQMLDQMFDEIDNPEAPREHASGRAYALDEDAVLEHLRIGVAVEIKLGSEPSIGRLNWINPNRSNLVLSLDGRDSPSMISVTMFLRMLSRGRVRFLEVEPLFERAVHSLLVSADNLDETSA